MSTAIKTREIQYTAPDGSHLIGYFAAQKVKHLYQVSLLVLSGGVVTNTLNNVRVNLLNTVMLHLQLTCMAIKSNNDCSSSL